jgi:hypothetical protein
VRFATAPAGAGAFPPARVSQRRWRLWHTELRERPPPRGPLHGAEGPSPGCCSPSGPVPSLTHPPRSWSVRRSSVCVRARAPAMPGSSGAAKAPGRTSAGGRQAGRQPTKTSLSEDSFMLRTARLHGVGWGWGVNGPPTPGLGLPGRTQLSSLISQSKSHGRPTPLCLSPGEGRAWVACNNLEPNSAPPALQGPTSLHLPSTPLAHPHPPSPQLPAGPLTARASPGGREGRLGGIHCPKLPLSAVHKTQHLHRSGPGHLPHRTQTHQPKEPAQPCPPPPMRRSPRSCQNSTINSSQADPPHSHDIFKSSSPLCSQHLQAKLQEIPYCPHLTLEQIHA